MSTVADVFLLCYTEEKKLVCWNAVEGGVMGSIMEKSNDKCQFGRDGCIGKRS